MTFEIALMLALLAAALVAFVRETFPIEVTALGLLAAVLLAGLVTPEQAFSGFSNKAVITLGSLFLLSHALVKTGILGVVANWVNHHAGGRPWLGIGMLLALVGILSGFLNNTAVVAIFIPLIIDLCRRFELSPSKVLIPLSYVAIVGGTVTLVGTSTNLLVSSVLEKSGQRPFGMFEFSSLGLIFLAVGLLYVLLFARRLLPTGPDRSALTRAYEIAPYLTEVRVQDGSPLIGKSLRELALNEKYRVTVLALVRNDQRYILELGSIPLQAGDLLIVQARVEDVLKIRRSTGLALLSDVKMTDAELSEGGLVVAEAVIPENSRMVGQTLREFDFRARFGGFVLAIRRAGVTLSRRIARTRFRFFDSLLVLVPESRLEELKQSDDLVVTGELDVQLHRGRLWWLVLVLMPLVVALAAFEVMEIAAAAVIAAVALLLAGVLTPREGYRAVSWPVIFLIAAFVPVGQAFIESGAAGFLADGLLWLVKRLPASAAPHVLLALIYLVTSLLTQVVSNNAAAIVVAPVALSLAAELGISPRPFVIAVTFAASAEFMTPMGYQTNLMVYGPGAYRFTDYTRFGAPLNLAFWGLAVLLIPRLFPF